MNVNKKIEEGYMIKMDEKFLTVFEAEVMTGRKASTWRRDILLRPVSVVRFGRSVRIPESYIHIFKR